MLKAIWTSDPAAFQGKFYTLPKSHIQPKPAQKPHPPIYMAAYAPGALQRIARYGDGWNPVGIPVEGMRQMYEGLKGMAKEAGRDPKTLAMIVRANVEIREAPRPKDGPIFTGTMDQIREDVEGCKRIGADEIFFDPTFSPGGQQAERWLGLMEQLRRLV